MVCADGTLRVYACVFIPLIIENKWKMCNDGSRLNSAMLRDCSVPLVPETKSMEAFDALFVVVKLENYFDG